jgi:hypothetical protein
MTAGGGYLGAPLRESDVYEPASAARAHLDGFARGGEHARARTRFDTAQIQRVMRSIVFALLVLSVAPACTSWRAVQRSDGWTLFVKDGERVDVERFDRALAPAFAAVEEFMGPFERDVRVHAFDDGGETLDLTVPEAAGENLREVPGIGPARVRAFHVRGGPVLFAASGVFLGAADTGTAVHELVHARLADAREHPPLWFEEGLASFLGDGAHVGGRWHVDGLACWPLRELRDQRLDDRQLARLLDLTADDDYDARENLLVHFVGWAIVFDLARELPDAGWEVWLAHFGHGVERRGRNAEARARIERTLAEGTELAWLERLDADDPALRIAAAKGTWKLRDPHVIDLLLDRLEQEEEDEVRAALALNALLSTSGTRLGRARWNRFSSLVFPALRAVELDDARETHALRELQRAMRWWDSRRAASTQAALDVLARFWEE